MVRRKNKSKVAYDSEGGRIDFDEISVGGHTVYTAEIHNIVQKEVAVKQMFDIFGRGIVLKAEFVADSNFCRLSVLEGDAYSHRGAVGKHCKVVTYGDMRAMVDSYPTGECVDAVLCASYKDAGELTLAPYVYDWKSLSVIPKIIRAVIVGLVLAATVFTFTDSTVKDFLFLIFMLVKDSIVPLASSSLFM